MGLFSKVNAAVGVGASQVQVELESNSYHWNESVRGKLRVQGGETDQTASEIAVNVTETWIDVDSDGDREKRTRIHQQVPVATQIAIPAGSSQEWNFELQTPAAGPLDSEWSVAARICVPGAVDRHGKADFQLLPPAAIVALANVTCQVGECQLHSYRNQSSKVTVELRPLPHRQKDLDGLTLVITENGVQVSGTLEINPQEKSMADRIRALAKKDRVHHNIAFDSAALTATKDAANAPSGIADQLRALIAPHLS